MSTTPSLSELVGSPANAPHRHLNGDGALVALTFTPAQWAAADRRLISEHGAQRSIVARCPVRGMVSVDAFVVPTGTAAAAKPWSRTRGPRLAA